MKVGHIILYAAIISVVILCVATTAIPQGSQNVSTNGDDTTNKGSWFEYKVTEKTSDSPEVKTWTEKYEVMSINGGDVVFARYVDGVKKDMVNGDTSYANCLVRNDDLSKKGTEVIDTAKGEMTLDKMGSDRCGGATVVYQDASGTMYRSIEEQMWSRGIIHSVTRDLIDLG